ncbi:hypothetical protein ABIC28_004679 [Rhodococcus sp. PvR044]
MAIAIATAWAGLIVRFSFAATSSSAPGSPANSGSPLRCCMSCRTVIAVPSTPAPAITPGR